VAVAYLLLTCGMLISQTDFDHAQNDLEPIFHYDIIQVDSPQPGMSRIYIYLKTSFDELTFVREDSIFKAKYEVSVTVEDKNDFQVDGKVWQESAVAEDYEQTNSRRSYCLTYEKFDLEASEYNVTIGFTDLESQKTKTEKQKAKLQDFKKENLAISELAFVRNLVVDSLGVKSFNPEIANYLSDLAKNVFVYFEIYTKDENDKNFEISYVIKNAKRKKLYEDTYKRRVDGTRTLEYFTLADRNLSQGAYELTVKVVQPKYKAETTKRFIVRWANIPSTIDDIELAIKQLKYIAEKKEWDNLKKASKDEKFQSFKKFWDRRDPSPGTEENEWMDQYYYRVAYANANFGGFREGWKSDMGMIFIIFGPPSDIERHPFDSDQKPYEIWYYYTINRNFIFQDRTGFGDYKLITQSWEDWRSLIRY
jgi:GWxTD domain-containing protein